MTDHDGPSDDQPMRKGVIGSTPSKAQRDVFDRLFERATPVVIRREADDE